MLCQGWRQSVLQSDHYCCLCCDYIAWCPCGHRRDDKGCGSTARAAAEQMQLSLQKRLAIDAGDSAGPGVCMDFIADTTPPGHGETARDRERQLETAYRPCTRLCQLWLPWPTSIVLRSVFTLGTLCMTQVSMRCYCNSGQGALIVATPSLCHSEHLAFCLCRMLTAHHPFRSRPGLM